MGDEPAQERQIRGHPADLGRGERVGEPVERRRARRRVCDQLCDQRVVAGADLVALLDAGVDAHSRRQPQPFERPRLRQERPGILGVEAHLDGVPVGEARRPSGKAFSRSDPQLLLDEVEAGDRLRDRVLDLDPAIQLQEVRSPFPASMNSAVPALR